MFSQPPSKPVATSNIRILVLIISLSRYIADQGVTSAFSQPVSGLKLAIAGAVVR